MEKVIISKEGVSYYVKVTSTVTNPERFSVEVSTYDVKKCKPINLIRGTTITFAKFGVPAVISLKKLVQEIISDYELVINNIKSSEWVLNELSLTEFDV